MTDEAKLCSPIHSAFEALVVWCAIKPCHGEELGPFCWPVPASSLECLVRLDGLLSTLLRCDGFPRIQKAAVDQRGRRQPDSGHDLFGCRLVLGSALELLLSPAWPLPVVLWNPLFIAHHSSRNGLLLCRVREDSKVIVFYLQSSYEAARSLSSRSIFPIHFKCWPTVIVKLFGNFRFDDPLNQCLSAPSGPPLCSSSSRLSSPLAKLRAPLALYVRQ